MSVAPVSTLSSSGCSPLVSRHINYSPAVRISSGLTCPCYRLYSAKANGGLYEKIAFIGAGKMSQAMISPLVKSGIQPASCVSVYDVSTTAIRQVSEGHPGVIGAQSIVDCVSGADLIVLAIKPQNVDKVYAEIRKAQNRSDDDGSKVKIHPEATLLSVIAGKPIDSFIEGTGITKVARCMPNTPAQIGKGVTVWSCTDGVDLGERKKIKEILCSFGKTVSPVHTLARKTEAQK